MSNWFEGSTDVACSLDHVATSLQNLGEHYARAVGQMPGITSTELLDSGADFVTIQTNEGRMERTKIKVEQEGDRIHVEFDESYDAGKVTVNSHYTEEFLAAGECITHNLSVRIVEAPGILGFLYRKFGGSNMGTASLAATKAALEQS